MDNSSFSVCSLFAGIGGIDIAFEQNGFSVVWANEIDDAACKTYAHNSNNPIVNADIRTIDPKTIPDFNVLTGGFPCQPFSIAGDMRGFKDPRGNLFFEIARIIDVKRPDVVFLENVENLIHHDNGKTFLVVYASLAQFGYVVRYRVMSPVEYGNLPQTRKRTFIIAFKDYQRGEAFNFPEKVKLTCGINDIIHRSERQNEVYYYNSDDPFYQKYNEAVNDYKAIYRVVDRGVIKAKDYTCPTLLANMGTYPNRVPVLKDDYGLRKLTLRECLAFQGFPKDFYFPNTITIKNAYKQIGNSVCVPVVSALAKQIKAVL